MRWWWNRWLAIAAIAGVGGCSFDPSGLDFAEPDAGLADDPAEPRAGDPGASLPPTVTPPGGVAFCPSGATFDASAGFCVDGDDAYGPFTHQMVVDCRSAAGGYACDSAVPVKIGDRVIPLPRWSLAMAMSLRGTGD